MENIETTMGAALNKAGLSTATKRVDAAISNALAMARGNERKAAGLLWMVFQKEKDLALEAMIQLIWESRERNGDEETEAEVIIETPVVVYSNSPPPKERLQAMEKSRNSSANTIFDRTTLHTGRPIGNVHYDEFPSLIEDGEIIKAIKIKIGYVPVDKRGTVREMMSASALHQVLNAMKAKV